MTYLRRIAKGEILPGYPTDAHNAFFETYVKVSQQETRGNGTGQSSSCRELTCIVWNETEAAIDVDFPVLELAEPVFTPADNNQAHHRQPEFKGTTPDGDTRDGCWAVVQGPISDDAGVTGRAAVLIGPTFVDVEFDEGDEAQEFANIKAGDNTQLMAAGSGVPIIWHAEIPDPEYLPATVRCLVILGGGAGGGVDAALVRLTATLDAATGDPREPGITSSYTVIKGTASGEIENWSLVEIPSTTYLGIIKIDGDWMVWPAFC